MAKKKAVAAKPVKPAKKPAKSKAPAAAPAPEAPTDSRGTKFDPEVHAVKEDGAPHADSAGNFIAKTSHYDGAKKAHYGDTFRHA